MTLSAPTRRFASDQSGLAAVEFALVLPVLLLLALGLAEVGRFALLSLKLQHAATTMADLVSRDEALTVAAVQSMFSATGHIVQPFDIADQGVVVLSGIGVDPGKVAAVFWQQHGAGKLARASDIGTSGGKATLPKDLAVRDGETVIAAEVFFSYEPWLLRLVPATLLRRVAYFRPRLGTLRSLG